MFAAHSASKPPALLFVKVESAASSLRKLPKDADFCGARCVLFSSTRKIVSYKFELHKCYFMPGDKGFDFVRLLAKWILNYFF